MFHVVPQQGVGRVTAAADSPKLQAHGVGSQHAHIMRMKKPHTAINSTTPLALDHNPGRHRLRLGVPCILCPGCREHHQLKELGLMPDSVQPN